MKLMVLDRYLEQNRIFFVHLVVDLSILTNPYLPNEAKLHISWGYL